MKVKKKTKKKSITFDLQNKGALELARDVSMMRCIRCGLLKKNGAAQSKDSLMKDSTARYKAFMKKPKYYREFVILQTKPSPPRSKSRNVVYNDDRISMFEYRPQPTIFDVIYDYEMRQAYANDTR